ncbi:MAG TPA: hypothetical protein VGD47_01360, partial [Steroidobacteraceae bacterium]
MSPLWRDEVGAYLSPHRLCLVRMKRGAKPTPVAEHEQRFEGVKTDSWAAALEALAAMLAQSPWTGARTRVVIADHWVRYAIVPWAGALNSADERIAHGRQLLSSLYGEAIAGWDLQVSDAPPQATRVVCAVPGELIAAVRSACEPSGNTLLSLQPQLVAAYEAWRHCLPAANAWFVSVEPGSLAAARLGPHGWDRVHGVRIGSDWMRELKRLQTFGRLASNSPEEGQVYVDAPHAWREVAAGTASAVDGSALQWLEEPSGPLTTLQRLGRTRR